MIGRLLSARTLPTPCLTWQQQVFVVMLAATPLLAHANPSNFGTFTRDASPVPGSIVSGTYRTPQNATGRFKIGAGATTGYGGYTVQTGDNGIEIKNEVNTNNDRDKFTYTITITPDDKTSIHTIKIGQASYTTSGNSEVARQTLSHTTNPNFSVAAQATIRDNPSVEYFFGAMGDYFMGKRLSRNSFSSNNTTNQPQLRVDSFSGGNNNLYYYNLTALNGTGNSSSFTPTTNANGYVSFASGRKRGILPPTPTFENILKENSTNPNNQNTYAVLSSGTVIPNNSSYVSYGIENSKSNYIIAVRNAESVTLTYDGIMQGNSALEADVVGETYNEWISFGVESEPLYVFSGKVFNDNGGINDANADASAIGGIYNNNRYFNGIWDRTPSASPEQGIADSTIRLVNNCTNPTKEYGRQTITTADAGSYQFVLLPTAIDNSATPGCIIETRTNASYPIRTTSATNPILFSASNFTYLDNNFGRVIDKNAALVLTKYQYINHCPSALDYPNISNTADDTPLTGFSTKNIDKIEPGQCIAYKITATNRANKSIDNFVMQDILQQAGKNSATVTSRLTNPAYNTADYATDSVAIGNNGTVKTIPLSLAPQTQRSFYFNTKYGTTMMP